MPKPASVDVGAGSTNHVGGDHPEAAAASLPTISPPQTHSMLMSPLVKFAVSAQSGVTGPQSNSSVSRPAQAVSIISPPKPKRSGSLALFYRKVYQLAFVRIKDLCERLALPCETQQK